ncbi:PEP-CTERM/exosortase system-associated acyltransferase [Marinobacter panjinensis]|uniref:PEP-CTERM/exosortase system-associated acyltransferase n=1 Tax=Marinobacter panjinensis TaxID=2576384 RepID=A0A4U6QTV4_9GAMM|nr:PEP-CTERM/exosortase system-associated acyltransferase [Marinobacter panjinensis]MCR8915026.1 PEP-CTERM/exosortase system-associated acyltransferase [Marinobacter panjinensis]TKV64263.1 PEP-CTERM/exosortase system-associated acyltransferase [Marinobacter panjinensis]
MPVHSSFHNEGKHSTAFGGTENLSDIFKSFFKIEVATTEEMINKVFEVRYQVYCIDRPFEDPDQFPNNREHDAYDSGSAHALIRHRRTGDSVAVVRLVLAGYHPEQSDFPMEEPCIHRMSEQAQDTIAETPRQHMAEISRMAVCREFRRRLNEQGSPAGVTDQTTYADAESGKRAMPYISLGLFAAILRMSVKHNVTHWMAIMEPTQLRLLKRFGVEFDHVGPVIEYHGLRRPAFTEAASLINGILRRRPDVWDLITESGRYLPPIPLNRRTTAPRR